MRALLLNKIKQTYPTLMQNVKDIKLTKLENGSYFATLQTEGIIGTKYINFDSATDFKIKCSDAEEQLLRAAA